MIERAIENWLIKTNERNYQLPFCQVLLKKGHKIIDISKHRSMEQGKDIITIDKKGESCAYQLKTGDIKLSEWRNISGEIKELIELPIIHPRINKNKIHKSFLVTNGNISDEVRIQIDLINSDNKQKERNYSYLDIISRNELLKDFIDAQCYFMPKEIKDFHSFLNLFLKDGKNKFPKEKFMEFLDKFIFHKVKKKSDILNSIYGSAIFTSYTLNNYQSNKNYFALFEAWTCLAVSILYYVTKEGIKGDLWKDSFDLIKEEITNNLRLLKKDVLSRKNFLEGDIFGDGGLMYKARTTICLGCLALLETFYNSGKIDKDCVDAIKNNQKYLWFWGESAFPFFFMIIKYLEKANEKEMAKGILEQILSVLINNNSPRSKMGIANPYYKVDNILLTLYGYDNKTIDFLQFRGSSYILEIVIEMMVRRNIKAPLEKNWRLISHIQFKEFQPKNDSDYFKYYNKEGTNYSDFPTKTQSWKLLKDKSSNQNNIPNIFKENKEILPSYLLVLTHRVNKLIIRFLDQKI